MWKEENGHNAWLEYETEKVFTILHVLKFYFDYQ